MAKRYFIYRLMKVICVGRARYFSESLSAEENSCVDGMFHAIEKAEKQGKNSVDILIRDIPQTAALYPMMDEIRKSGYAVFIPKNEIPSCIRIIWKQEV